jgi:hypothetical protein
MVMRETRNKGMLHKNIFHVSEADMKKDNGSRLQESSSYLRDKYNNNIHNRN